MKYLYFQVFKIVRSPLPPSALIMAPIATATTKLRKEISIQEKWDSLNKNNCEPNKNTTVLQKNGSYQRTKALNPKNNNLLLKQKGL